MDELFPVVAGLVVGVVLTVVAPRLRFAVGAAAAVVLGTAATVLSGEYRIGWEFLLVDIPLVAASSALSLLVSRRVRRALVEG
jgi:hypothetical protein